MNHPTDSAGVGEPVGEHSGEPQSEQPDEQSGNQQGAPPAVATAAAPPSCAGRVRTHLARWWPMWAMCTALVATALLVVASVTTVESLVLTAPGSTVEVDDLLEVDGAETFASRGDFSLVTVSTVYRPSPIEVALGWLDDAVVVRDAELLLGDGTPEDRIAQGLQLMARSQDVAIAVALERLGYDVTTPLGALVVGTEPGSAADGVLSVGQIVFAVDGEPVATATELAEAISSRAPGQSVRLEMRGVTVSSGEQPADDDASDTANDAANNTVRVVTLGDREGRGYLGVRVETFIDVAAEPPVDVQLTVDGIGGPSAGLALTLGVLDQLTPGDLAGGNNVVATGSMSILGDVGPVGGVTQKAHAALRSGADLILVPTGQEAAATEVVDGLVPVVGVSTLDEALAALEAAGGDLTGIGETGT